MGIRCIRAILLHLRVGQMPIEQILRNHVARLSLAALLIVLCLWAFTPYLLYRVASSAFINAPLLRVTSPMPGQVTEQLPGKGHIIEQTSPAVLVAALSSDRGPLLDLQRQRLLAEKSSELAAGQLNELNALDDKLSVRIAAYHDAVVRRLSIEAAGADAERRGCLAELKQLRQAGAILADLAKSGHASEMRSAQEFAKDEAVATRCEVVGTRIAKLQGELAAARDSIYLGDGVNDVPYSQQQKEHLVLRRQELEADVLRESLRSAQLQAAITAEEDRLARRSSYSIELPAGQVVWSVASSPGSTVTEGQTILDLANCEQSFVEVELPARDFEQIKTNDTAAVRLIGDGTWYRAAVQRVRGSAARADDRLLAAQSSRVDRGRLTVELKLPADVLPRANGTYCGIGRLAEVRFKRIPLDFADRFMRGFQELGAFFGWRSSQMIAADR
jgi:multidrug resistance efflux pump